MNARRTIISLLTIFALIASTFAFAQTQRRRQTQEPRRGLGVKENSAASGKRFALVIGNSNYVTVVALKNPSNDARAIARALRGYGFDVIEGENATQQQMRQAIRKFGENLRTAGAGSVGLFYFAGHGVQLRDHNYLIPVDAQIETEADVEDGAMSADYVLAQMADAQNSANNPANNTASNAGNKASPKRTFQNRAGIELVLIPPGSFRMGGDKRDDEKPVHEVTINYSFYMGRTEVT